MNPCSYFGNQNKEEKIMACGKCNKKNNEKHDLLYIMNPNCGWCKKADLVVDELIKDGYEITTLDVTNQEEAERANSIKAKHKAQCGTPLFLDAETGNMLCGFREKDVLEGWAKGEESAPPPTSDNPTPQKYKLEYIWIDGNDTKTLRSKVKYQTLLLSKHGNPMELLNTLPEWSFDGSSTNQAETENSDCILKPVNIFQNPMDTRQSQMQSVYVLCEVYNLDGTPHESNTRNALREAIDSLENDENLLVGVEQEYIFINSATRKPYGWDKYDDDVPPPQGDYYCGIGAETNKMRHMVEHHANTCLQSGISLEGFHPEVMLSQWEYQIGVGSPLHIADHLWMSRFLLQRIGERMDISISYDPKLVDGDWNGSGAHINFSTRYMREESDMGYMNLLCANLQDTHSDAIKAYGKENDKRLTGKHETSSIDKFTWGESDRSSSIRIPASTIKNEGKGHLEDRRPSANVDPYEAFSYLASTVANINEELLVST